jgi:flagellar protein FliS
MNRQADETYLSTQVKTATPQRLRLMLIDGALRLAGRTRQRWSEGQFSEATEDMIRCQSIVCELMASTRRDQAPELVDKVVSLYFFVHTRLVQAQMQRDQAKLDDAIQILEIERETWRQVCAQSETPSVPRAHFDLSAVESAGFSAEA